MCLAIVAKPGSKLPKDDLRRAFAENPHGAGFAYLTPAGDLARERMVGRGFRHFWRLLREKRDSAGDSTFLIHFRLATHGTRDTSNCHPFYTKNKTAAVIHNGIIGGMTAGRLSAGKSDTAIFVDDVLSYLERFVDQPAVREYLENLTRGSKLAWLRKDGSTRFLHENMGTWIDGVWYSNLHHKYVKAASRTYASAEELRAYYLDQETSCGTDRRDIWMGRTGNDKPPAKREPVPLAKFPTVPDRMLQPGLVKGPDGKLSDPLAVDPREEPLDLDFVGDGMDDSLLQDVPSCWYCGESVEHEPISRLDGQLACRHCLDLYDDMLYGGAR